MMNISTEKDGLFYTILAPNGIHQLVSFIIEIMRENKSHNLNLFNEKAWVWQHQKLPSKKSRVYIVKREEEILGYYHVPIYQAIFSGEIKTLAMIQEVAVSKKIRGKGVFRNLADFVHQDLLNSSIDFIYTFPNYRSIHTFINYNGYTNIKTFNIYILPTQSSNIIRSRINLFGFEKAFGFVVNKSLSFFSMPLKNGIEIILHNTFNHQLINVFNSFIQSYSISLIRDFEYLNWRYLEKPNSKHYIFSIEENNKPQAVAIFKLDEIFNNNVLLLMDFAFEPEKNNYLLQLLNEIKITPKKYIAEDFNLIFTTGLNRFYQELWKIGFMSIPGRFIPRQLNLLVKNCKLQNKEIIYKPESWNVTLSDWDVF